MEEGVHVGVVGEFEQEVSLTGAVRVADSESSHHWVGVSTQLCEFLRGDESVHNGGTQVGFDGGVTCEPPFTLTVRVEHCWTVTAVQGATPEPQLGAVIQLHLTTANLCTVNLC